MAKIVYSIYKHTTPDGLVYIGATAQKPKNRWNNGESYKFVPKFYEAINRFEMDKQWQNQGGQGCQGLPNTERGN